MSEQPMTIASDEDTEYGYILVNDACPKDAEERLARFVAQMKKDWGLVGDPDELLMSVTARGYRWDKDNYDEAVLVPAKDGEEATEWWYVVTGLDAFDWDPELMRRAA